jgi:dipeptidyl aminopeptidase/acylaminoacyl peptidase
MTYPNLVAPVEPPPSAVLFGAPEHASVVPAPDGSRIAYIAPVEGTPNVWLADVEGNHGRPLTVQRGQGIASVQWTHDGAGLLYLQDNGGDENHHLFLLDIATGDTRDLTPHQGVQAQLIGASVDRPRQVAVALNLEDRSRHDLYVLDLDSGELGEPVLTGATRYAVDGQLRPRLAVRLAADGSAELVTDGGRVIDTVGAADTVPLILGQLAVSHDGRTAVALSSSGLETVALVAYDLSSGARSILYVDARFDVAGFSADPATGQPDLVCVDAARRRWHPLAEERRADLDLLQQATAADVVDIHRTRDDQLWVVKTVSDAASAAYLTYRRGAVPRQVFLERPALQAYRLGTTEPFAFRSSDGLEVHGYVTWPPHRPRQALPAILWVHGGPWARDRWGFDPIVQFLATRGYACVQVNYRGSTGYGKRFLDAGDRQWGRRMQRDLDEALAELARNGSIDLSRVAIAGGSYGGYATLMGLVQHPDAYACGVAYCAPSNLLTLLKSFPPYWGPLLAHWHSRVGHPDRDRVDLWEASPLAHVDDLRAPLLLVHGANDPRVLCSESKAIAEALAERGVPHTFHVVADEGHGFVRPENNIWLLDEIEKFLAAHLPADEASGAV